MFNQIQVQQTIHLSLVTAWSGSQCFRVGYPFVYIKGNRTDLICWKVAYAGINKNMQGLKKSYKAVINSSDVVKVEELDLSEPEFTVLPLLPPFCFFPFSVL